MKNQNLFLFLLLFLGNMILYGQCGVNAGGNTTICGTSYTLQGTSSGDTNGAPVWTIVSKPAGAPDPVFSNVNSLTPNVTGMTFPGNYVFQVAQNCNPSGTVTSQVTINAPGATTGFTAGPDITTIPASTGVANLNATIPSGYTASWTYYNINSYEFNGTVETTNATMTGITTATPTLTLTKKADHDIDPAYRVTLRITSTNNPSCWYEDSAIVRFIPNPNVSFANSKNQCGSMSTIASNRYFYESNSSSPKFSDNTANASANPAFGTTISMMMVSQPAGGNLTYDRISNGRIYFAASFNQTPGAYVFKLTITNANGTYTTPNLTYNYNGSQPEALSFLDPAHPEQMELYSPGSSGGAVYCNRAGTITPITFYFKIDPADPATLTSTVTPTGIIPAGGAPSIAVNGAGTRNRSVTLTPPTGGWRVGTYKFSVSVGNGTCNVTRVYYVHISDGGRTDVKVDNMTVCYPGSGLVSATIPLPAVYKGIVSPSYFQDYGGRYELTVLSRPAGSAVPTFDPLTLRTFTNTSTVISNLNMQGEYRFRIKAIPSPGGDPGFIDKEYACSNASKESEFSIFVSAQIGANAGSNQNVTGTTTTLNGNNPGVAATGTWTVVTKPAGVSNPVIVDPSLYNSAVTGLTGGTYVFRWSVATGTCISTSDVTVNVTTPDYCTTGCNENTFLNTTNPNTIEYDNLIASDAGVIAKEKDGTFKIWGYVTAPTSIPSNINVLKDLLTPTAITPANGFNYTGTPLKAAIAGNPNSGALLLTTDGLYGWGSKMVPYTKTTNDTNPQFGKITINGKTDGLPPGVSPTDVKMLFQTFHSLTIVTCKGEAWTMYGGVSNNIYGDGSPNSPANNAIWHRVKTSATETLDNVVAVRGSAGAKLALTSEGKLYTWGRATYIGDGTDNAVNGTDRAFATEVVVPAGVTPKMIGMTEDMDVGRHAYFLLGTNGKLYSMGNNNEGILANGTNTSRNTWQEVTATSGSHTLGGNIVWISPNEHGNDTHPTMNVLTSDKKQWGWGSNFDYKLGQSDTSGSTLYSTPIYMPGNTTNANGMGLNDEIIAVETGGRFTINYKKTSQYFGFVGLSQYGTIGNGTTGNTSHNKYTYNTGLVDMCGLSSTVCDKPGTAGTPLLSSVGILTKAGTSVTNWPESVPNGYLVLDGAFKGMVINRMTTAQINALTPVEGMLAFDTDLGCVKLYRGTAPVLNPTASGWVCIERVCIDTN